MERPWVGSPELEGVCMRYVCVCVYDPELGRLAGRGPGRGVERGHRGAVGRRVPGWPEEGLIQLWLWNLQRPQSLGSLNRSCRNNGDHEKSEI